MFYKGNKQRDREHCGNARQASIKHHFEVSQNAIYTAFLDEESL